jgi:predicted DNA-binding transcriptional regulator AlpA
VKERKNAVVNYVAPQPGRAQVDAGDHRIHSAVHAQGDMGIAAMEKLWSSQELADFLGLPIQTIYQWRKRNYGPPGRRMGKHIRYRRSEVERWIDSLDGWAA